MWLLPMSNHCLLSAWWVRGPWGLLCMKNPRQSHGTWSRMSEREELVRGGGDWRGQKDKQSWQIPVGQTKGTSPNKPVSIQEGHAVAWFLVFGGCKIVCVDFILQSRLPLLEQRPIAWIIVQVPLPLLCNSKQKQFSCAHCNFHAGAQSWRVSF